MRRRIGQGIRQRNPPAAARVEERPALEHLSCSKCGQGSIIEGRRDFGWSRYREGCEFVVWTEISGKRLTEKQLHALIGKGKTGSIKGSEPAATFLDLGSTETPTYLECGSTSRSKSATKVLG